jgi:hypothetical protein
MVRILIGGHTDYDVKTDYSKIMALYEQGYRFYEMLEGKEVGNCVKPQKLEQNKNYYGLFQTVAG